MDLLSIGKTNNIERDKFVSRFFGLFNEEIARIYFNSSYSMYLNLGRPTIKKDGKKYTLDFTLKNKETEKIYICEMKCEMQYNNYSRLELEAFKQISSHKKEAFKWFLDIANNPSIYKIETNKNAVNADGIILLWGKITNDIEKIIEIKKHFNIHDILSLENMINIMIKNDHKEYYDYINKRKKWINDFFEKCGY